MHKKIIHLVDANGHRRRFSRRIVRGRRMGWVWNGEPVKDPKTDVRVKVHPEDLVRAPEIVAIVDGTTLNSVAKVNAKIKQRSDQLDRILHARRDRS